MSSDSTPSNPMQQALNAGRACLPTKHHKKWSKEFESDIGSQDLSSPNDTAEENPNLS